jgi:hypothetical protein
LMLGGIDVDELIVIVPCGQRKVCDEEPDRGPVRAKDVYKQTGEYSARSPR